MCVNRSCGSPEATRFSSQVITALLDQLRQQGVDRVLPVPCLVPQGRRRLTNAGHVLGKPRTLLQAGYADLLFVLIFQNPSAARRGAQIALETTTSTAFLVILQ